MKMQQPNDTGEFVSVRKLGKKNEVKKEKLNQEFSKIPDLVNSDLPMFKVNVLPSGFKIYPEGSTIYYKPYSWNGVKLLTQSKMDTVALWNYILEGVTCSFDKDLLTLQDFFYIALLRRVATVGNNKFSVSMVCKNNIEITKNNEKTIEKCNTLNHFVLNDKQINFDDLQLSRNELPVQLKLLGKWYQFSPITIGNAKYLFENNLLDDDNSTIAVQCINETFENISKVLESNELSFLEGEKTKLLENFFYHGILPINKDSNDKELICSHCNNKLTIQLDGGEVVIRPFRESGDDDRDGICFGIQNESTNK